jgi:malonyl-CoA decarboxylase
MPEDVAQKSSPPEVQADQAGVGRMTTLSRTLSSVLEVGRDLLARRRQTFPEPEAVNTPESLIKLCTALLEHRGEASGLALASEVVQGYQALPSDHRLEFFMRLAHDFEVDREKLIEAFERYKSSGELENLWSVNRVLEAPRQKLFRRINTAPEGTSTLVKMRGHLLDMLRAHPELRGVESDLKNLFIAWFNKGFLEMRRIDWTSSAAVLEKIIAYEAVHEINGWEDLRSRLGEDRRCFAFFHPALADDPLVFVEIALVDAIPSALAPLLQQDREVSLSDVNTVVFYSISNCHPGLAQISFGNFLIKSVVEELKKEIQSLNTFVTLSPVPGFRKWLLSADLDGLVSPQLMDRVREPVGQVVSADTYDALMKLCSHYLYNEKSGRLPRDPVARFHLGNGARLHGLNGNADLSAKGREQSAGIMVNYLYDLSQIEENHDAYFDSGTIAISKEARKWLG